MSHQLSDLSLSADKLSGSRSVSSADNSEKAVETSGDKETSRRGDERKGPNTFLRPSLGLLSSSSHKESKQVTDSALLRSTDSIDIKQLSSSARLTTTSTRSILRSRQCTNGQKWKFPHEYDVGIFWFGNENKCERFVPGVDNRFFSPERPSVLYCHGWEPGSVKMNFRETFNWFDNYPMHRTSLDHHCADDWIAAGYNIGIFYWNQHSDESMPHLAEAKIWTAHGPRGLRWCSMNEKGSVQFHDTIPQSKDPAPSPNLTENKEKRHKESCSIAGMLVDLYIKNFATGIYTGGEVRMIGHSMGTQLATRATHMLWNLDKKHLARFVPPSRLILVDVYFSRPMFQTNAVKQAAGGKYIAEAVCDYLHYLGHSCNIPIEIYKSSIINDIPFLGQQKKSLRKLGVFFNLKPNIFGLNLEANHVAGPNIYFASMRNSSDPSAEEQTHNKLYVIGEDHKRKLIGTLSPLCQLTYGELEYLKRFDVVRQIGENEFLGVDKSKVRRGRMKRVVTAISSALAFSKKKESNTLPSPFSPSSAAARAKMQNVRRKSEREDWPSADIRRGLNRTDPPKRSGDEDGEEFELAWDEKDEEEEGSCHSREGGYRGRHEGRSRTWTQTTHNTNLLTCSA